MSQPAFQHTNPAYSSAALAQPLLGAYSVTLDGNRFHLPVTLRDTLRHSAVEQVGVYVNVDHIEIIPLTRTNMNAPDDRFLVTLVRNEIVAAVKVAEIGHRSRIGIPKQFVQALDLDPALLLVGMQDRIEIWNGRRYFAKAPRDTSAGHPIECAKYIQLL